LDGNLEEMYGDAMCVQELYFLEYEASLNNGEWISEAWKRLSDRLQILIERTSRVDLERAKRLLETWEAVGEGEHDFRALSSNALRSLLPEIQKTMNVLYGPFEFTAGDWIVKKTDSGFMTLAEAKSGRLIHSSYDPMHEAWLLAKKLYREGQDRFHLLGSGLGYLAYQLWMLSEKSLKIILYEEDVFILQLARQMGVLDWIDDGSLEIISCDGDDTDSMLRKFWEGCLETDSGYYVSDWKQGKYTDSEYGAQADRIATNLRIARTYGVRCRINSGLNRKLLLHTVEELKNEIRKNSKRFAVVSAGPSLNDSIEFLKNNAEDLMILAGNTTLKRLKKEGIQADMIVMLDPLPGLGKHIEGVEDYTEGVPLVSVIGGSNAFMRSYRGDIYIASEGYRGTAEDFPWMFSGTVTGLALDTAVYLGAETVYLIGSDLAYPGGINYADGLVHGIKEGMAQEQAGELIVDAVDGSKVRTNLLYNSYREMIEQQIAAHPNVKVYNMSAHGALIRGAAFYDGRT